MTTGLKGLIEVHTRPLCEAVEHPSNLVALERNIRGDLVFEDPFAGDDVGAQRTRNKIPCVVLQERNIFIAACQFGSARALWKA